MPTNTQMFDLTGQVALVTGGGSGIGKAIAAAMVQHGAKVVIGSRTKEKIDAAAKEIDDLVDTTGQEPVADGVVLDVQSQASVQRAVRRAVDVFGGLNILVNSAGVMLKQPAFDIDPDEFNNVYDLNVTGSLRAAQEAGHIFREQHGGSIINIASVSSFVDLTGVAGYAATKNAVLGLTRSLSNEWAKFGIRANAIAPGFIPTEINRKMIEGTDRGRRIIEHTPMQRFGVAEEIAGGAVYLASPAAGFVTGQTLAIDGGYLASGISDAVAPWEEDNLTT